MKTSIKNPFSHALRTPLSAHIGTHHRKQFSSDILKTRGFSVFAVCCGMILFTHSTPAAEIAKLFNNTALDQPGSWVGGTVPGASDVALWDSTFASTVTASTGLSPLGSNFALHGIKVTDVGGVRNAAPSFIGYKSPVPAKTLTLGAGGIDMSAATQTFIAYSNVTLAANQTWIIANANTNASPAGLNGGEDLALLALGANDPFDFGGKTLTTSGAGNVVVTSGYSVKNGSLDVGNNLFVIQSGSNRVTTIEADFSATVSAGTLQFRSNSGKDGFALVSHGAVTVDHGTFEMYNSAKTNNLIHDGPLTLNEGSRVSLNLIETSPVVLAGAITANAATTIQVTGKGSGSPAGIAATGDLSGTGDILYQNAGSGGDGRLNFSGNNSGYSGAFDINSASGNRSLRMSSATAGSADAAWNVAADNLLEIHGVSVDLGVLTGAGSITNTGPSPAAVRIGSGVFAGTLSDAGAQPLSVEKIGPGNLILSGPNAYSGTTTVTGGHLTVSADQQIPTTAVFIVADGATLAVFQPQADITLFTGDIQLADGATLEIVLGSHNSPEFAPIHTANLTIDGAAMLRISGKNLTTGTFPLVDYATIGGSSGLTGLSLQLPPRTTGSLNNSLNGIGVTIDLTEQIEWVGDVSGEWDIAPSGTANWSPTLTGGSTRYIQGPNGSDAVNFTDSATGTGAINLTTALAPAGLSVNNSAKDYTFAGSGYITGATGLVKAGSGTLTLANTTANDFLGGTTIQDGVLVLGDGVTPESGVVSGPIENAGTLVLNRPDDFIFSNPISGSGILEKAATNTVTIGAMTWNNPIAITAGGLIFDAGGTLSGPISGTGDLEVRQAFLYLQGSEPNTRTGHTYVSSGSLRLEKAPNTQALGGDITVTGSATIAIRADEQIADTATLNVFGTSTDVLVSTTGKETFANANINGTSALAQLILRYDAEITGTATITQGYLGIASSHNATVHRVVMDSPTAITRIAGSVGPSTLNIGSGGITASAGEIQVKFNGNNFDAILNLGGDLTATGDLTISNGNYTGAALNVINFDAARVFDIAAGTTTTVAPDLGGSGSLEKTGDGTLILTTLSSGAHTGGTTVSAGSLIVNGSLDGATNVSSAATLGGRGTVVGPVNVTGTVAPDGALTATGAVTLAAGSSLDIGIANWTGTTAGTDWDLLAADALTLAASPGSKLTIRITGNPAGFAETAKTLVVASSVSPLAGFDATAIDIDATGFSGAGTFAVQQTANLIEIVYTAATGTPYSSWATANGLDATNDDPALDPDNDGLPNLVEYALGLNPMASSVPPGTFDGSTVTFTKGAAALAGGDVNFVIETSTDLGVADPWAAAVTHTAAETSPTISYTLPQTGPKRFARLKIVQAP